MPSIEVVRMRTGNFLATLTAPTLKPFGVSRSDKISERDPSEHFSVALTQVGGVNVDAISMQACVSAIFDSFQSFRPQPFVVTAINAHFIVMAQRQNRLMSYLNSADLCVADGSSLVLSSMLLGGRLPERITGIDLMTELCREASAKGKSVYLFGGKMGAASGAASKLLELFPSLNIVGVDRPPMGKEFDALEVERIRARIRDAAPDLLFVCLGVPLQERWIEEFVSDLPVGVVMGNGAAFDVLAGFFRRPPIWIQKVGMEWFYRLTVEPRRLWRRYLIGNTQFVLLVLKEAMAQMGSTSSRYQQRRTRPSTPRVPIMSKGISSLNE
jgi:N-acetylglucosaminyldiphosphoundecaprenol N-acetyl-beta-D-mannosaminyltransferase